MAKIRIFEIQRNVTSIQKIANASNLPASVIIKMRRAAKSLLEQLQTFDEIRMIKIKEFGGVQKEDRIEIPEDSPNAVKFREYVLQLLNTEVELDFEPVDVALFNVDEKSDLTAADLDNLINMGILKDEAGDNAVVKGSLKDTLAQLTSAPADKVEEASAPKKEYVGEEQ